jgi:hypothetical protein
MTTGDMGVPGTLPTVIRGRGARRNNLQDIDIDIDIDVDVPLRQSPRYPQRGHGHWVLGCPARGSVAETAASQ